MSRDDSQHHRKNPAPERSAPQELVVARTATNYWVVKRGGVALAGAMTEGAAERERDRIVSLAGRSVRRTLAGT